MLTFFLGIILLVLPNNEAQTIVCEKDLQNLINTNLNSQPATQGAEWGISISVLRKNATLPNWSPLIGNLTGELQYFAPASNTKLWTTSTIFQQLGPNYTFSTPILTRQVSGNKPGVIDELCIGTTGDPSILFSDLQSIVNQVIRANITDIMRLSLDTRYINGLSTPDEYEWGDFVYDYGAQPSAAVVNEQLVTLTIFPGNNVGDTIQVKYTGPGTDATVFPIDLTQSVTVANNETSTIDWNYIPSSPSLFIFGQMPLNTTPIDITVSVINPELHFTKLLYSLFQQNHIAVDIYQAGGASCTFNPFQTPYPPNVRLLTTLTSIPLVNLLNYTLLVSDNLYAELFLRTIGARLGRSGPQYKSTTEGLNIISQTASSVLGVNISLLHQSDGSGMSRHNLIAPLAFRQLLQGIWAQPWGKTFESLLPVGGETGTLANRFIGTPAQGKVHAKTGSLSGVNALSGYVDNDNYQAIVFSILENACACSSTPVRTIIDNIVVLLAELAPC